MKRPTLGPIKCNKELAEKQNGYLANGRKLFRQGYTTCRSIDLSFWIGHSLLEGGGLLVDGGLFFNLRVGDY